MTDSKKADLIPISLLSVFLFVCKDIDLDKNKELMQTQ